MVIISYVVIIGLGVGMMAAIYRVTSINGFRTGWQGVPVYLGLVGFLGRVASPRIILGKESMIVVNPLRTYIIPKNLISEASIDENGGLEVRTQNYGNFSASAYSGSIIDHFVGTSDEAGRKINAWLKEEILTDASAGSPRKQWTKCRWADFSSILCVLAVMIGGMWMLLTGV